MTFLDPAPDLLLEQLEPTDNYRGRVLRMAVQDAPINLFDSLEEGDILFIDSSHVSKTGSDVNDYLFRILPALQPGVLIHIHDVLYPFEYPATWIRDEKRSWNEAYIIRAFLQHNNAFEIAYFNDLVYNKYSDLTNATMPLCLNNRGGSLWLRKLGGKGPESA